MIPIGSLCVVVPPAFQQYVGYFVTVVAYLDDPRLRYEVTGDNLPFGGRATDKHLRVIRPPRSASPVTTNTKRDEPVSA